MKNIDYVYESRWYAWHPVRTDKGWVWLKYVTKIVDERPLVYCGLLETTEYIDNQLKQ